MKKIFLPLIMLLLITMTACTGGNNVEEPTTTAAFSFLTPEEARILISLIKIGSKTHDPGTAWF